MKRGRRLAPSSWIRSLRGRVRRLLEPSPSGRRVIRAYQRVKDALTTMFELVLTMLSRPSGAVRMSTELLDLLEIRRDITVIVPIYGAPEELERCLDALRRNSTWRGLRLLLIDDASADEDVDAILERAAKWPNVDVLRNDENLGYVQTVNRGLRRSSGDVILLNSDTEVTPRWAQGLAYAAHQDALIGTATAVSNNAGAFSVPQLEGGREPPAHLSSDEVGRVVTTLSERLYPDTPTGNGFCMFVKGEVLESVGYLDAENFPRAYGEENDLCMRATRAGWRHVVDDATFVHHSGSASFGAEGGATLRVAAQRSIDRLYPEYKQLAHQFVSSPAMRRVRGRVREIYEQAERTGRPRPARVLHVLHSGTGGAPWAVRDLAGALSDRFESFVLTSDRSSLRVFPSTDLTEAVREERLDSPLSVPDATRADYRSATARLLVELGIELVHIHHLAGHTLDLPAVARTLDIPVVMSLHDYYLVCPTIHLIDHRGDFCRGICTVGQGECPVPRQWRDGVPHLKHTWVKVWQRHTADMLENVDAVVAMTESSASIFEGVFRQVRGNMRIIEHGRDLEASPGPMQEPPPRHVDILLAGNIGPHKGGDLVRALRDIDREHEERLRFHFLGEVAADYRDLGVWHGTYEREEAVRRIADVAPRFVAVLSISAETYSYVLSEAWAAGFPVLVTDLGAQAERVRRYGGGWVLSHRNPRDMYERILELHEDEDAYRRAVSEAQRMEGVRSTAEMASDWGHLYTEVMEARRVLARSSIDRRLDHVPSE